MTQKTPTAVDRTTKWGLFRRDAVVFDDTTVLPGNWYETELDAQRIQQKLNNHLPYALKSLVIIKEVKINPADQGRIYEYAPSPL